MSTLLSKLDEKLDIYIQNKIEEIVVQGLNKSVEEPMAAPEEPMAAPEEPMATPEAPYPIPAPAEPENPIDQPAPEEHTIPVPVPVEPENPIDHPKPEDPVIPVPDNTVQIIENALDELKKVYPILENALLLASEKLRK